MVQVITCSSVAFFAFFAFFLTFAKLEVSCFVVGFGWSMVRLFGNFGFVNTFGDHFFLW